MQKHAYFDISKQYSTRFAPIPAQTGEVLYFDRRPITLPYNEDFPMMHWHDRYEIGVCEEGEGLFLSEGEFFSVSKGDMIFIAPKNRHYSRSLDGSALCRCRFAYFDAESVERHLSFLEPSEAERVRQNALKIPAVIRKDDLPMSDRLLAIMQTSQKGISDGGLAATLYLAGFMLEFGHTGSGQGSETVRERSAAAAAAEYISLHYGENESAGELARRCHLSESQLRRRFIAEYGVPPIAYRNRLRLQVATELLLRTRLTLSEIAERTGYNSASDLYRAFRALYGVSPSEYRKAYRS